MNQVTLPTIKAKQNKWWMNIHVLFSFLIVSQIYLLDHQVKHLDASSDKVCVICISSVHYIDTVASDFILNDNVPVSIYKSKIGVSIPKSNPGFYLSRAPPTIT